MFSQQGTFQLRNGSYFLIVNKASELALSVRQCKDYRKQAVQGDEPCQNKIDQVWMIEQVKPHEWQIVHALSTLVLQNEGSELKLHFGNWKSSQLFFLQKSDPKNNPNQYWIKENKNSTKLLLFDKKVQFKQRDYDDLCTKWKLIPVSHNDYINRSCYLQFAYSNQVLDVPQANDKNGQYIIQWPLNKRFNQRWVLQKEGEYYAISNLKTKLYLDIKGQSRKEGAWVIQWKFTGAKNQLWSVQQQGKRLYLIRSALDKSLLLGVSGNILKEGSYIATTKSEAEAMWKIVGSIPR